MRIILVLSLVSGLGLCGSAWAGERETRWCAEQFAGANKQRACQVTLACQAQSSDPTQQLACVRGMIEAEGAQERAQIRQQQAADRDRWERQQEQARQADREAQVEAARQQALGMAAFGSGNALINGMNQGMQNMQVHPYVLPPAQNYQKR